MPGVSRPVAARDHPQAMASSSLTCADSINLLDNLPAIADPVSVGEPRPSALAREALLTDYASAQVSHVRWTGSTVARRPCAVPVRARGTGGRTGTAARAEIRCGRGHIASQRFCVVLSMQWGTSRACLVAQRGSQRPAMAIRRHGIASVHAICLSKPSVFAMSR
jgi:hypothetical protein